MVCFFSPALQQGVAHCRYLCVFLKCNLINQQQLSIALPYRAIERVIAVQGS